MNSIPEGQEFVCLEEAELPPEEEVRTETKVIPTDGGEITVTTVTKRRRRVRVMKNIRSRVVQHKVPAG